MKLKEYKASEAQGFAAISAIFLIVVIAALGGFMLTFANTQQLTSAQDIQGSRAYWAARAGLEWGIGSVVAVSTAACPTTSKQSSTELQIENFKVELHCTLRTYTEAGQAVNIFEFTSVATPIGVGAVGSHGFIERSVSAVIER
jgi:MSHA biogenesis protein MshP